MNFEIRFTPEAEETYEALVSQLTERWGRRFATKLENRILKSLNLISANPFIYPVAEAVSGVRKCILHKNCAMLYKVYEDEILIVCFWDNRQDPIFG